MSFDALLLRVDHFKCYSRTRRTSFHFGRYYQKSKADELSISMRTIASLHDFLDSRKRSDHNNVAKLEPNG